MTECQMCGGETKGPLKWVGWVNMAICWLCLDAVRKSTTCDAVGCNNDAAVWTWNMMAQKGLCTSCGIRYSGDAIWEGYPYILGARE